jgi:hypothetical protein
MKPGTSAIVTVAFGHSTERLDYTFLSFAEKNPGVPLHAFILGEALPQKRLPQITYHLVAPVSDYSHPLREVYYRRHDLIDRLDAEFVLVVDSYDVLCLQPLPPFAEILAGFDMAAVPEINGSRYLLGQGHTSHLFNGGATWWNVGRSRDIRAEILERGKARFRMQADDQFSINEVVQTKHFNRVRVLPCQYNYRPFYRATFWQRVRPVLSSLHVPSGWRFWPSVDHLDGVLIYHNLTSMDLVKAHGPFQPRAALPKLARDAGPLRGEWEQRRRKLQQIFCPGRNVSRD